MPYSRSRYPKTSGKRNWGRRRKSGFSLRWLPILLFAGYFGYYYLSHQEEVPLTGRSQLVDMDRKQEMALGLQSWRKIKSDSKIITTGTNADIIRSVGKRIAKAAAEQDPGFTWEFNLIDSNQINAFCLPGGKVAFYTGILPVAKNVDGIAAIMGHEIAHAIARHGAERMAHQKLVQFGTMAASMTMGDMGVGTRRAVLGALGAGGQYGVLLPFSRKHESEADYIGLLYAAKACFDPREAPELWRRMAKASGGGKRGAEFSSTHPTPATRIAQFKEWMPKAMEIYNQNCPN